MTILKHIALTILTIMMCFFCVRTSPYRDFYQVNGQELFAGMLITASFLLILIFFSPAIAIQLPLKND